MHTYKLKTRCLYTLVNAFKYDELIILLGK